MKNNTVSNPVISTDVMRYKKNKLAANLALGAIACDCLCFMFLYAVVGTDYYSTWAIAFDVIFNLMFLLLTFLLSEQVKGYDSKLVILQLILGAFQIGRIFWLPLGGLLAKPAAIDIGRFLILAISLAASGGLEIASAVIGYIRSKAVAEFNKKVEAGEIDIMEVIRQVDADEVAAKAAEAENAVADATPEVAEQASEEVQ